MLGEICDLHAAEPSRCAPGPQVRRSRARNIASVPCTCGHSCTSGPSPRSSTRPARGDAHAPRRASSRSTSRPAARSTSSTTSRVSAEVRRARDVGDHAAGPDRVERRAQQLALQRAERGQVRRACAASGPPGAGAARRGRCTGRRPAPGRTAPARPRPRAGRRPCRDVHGLGARATARAPARGELGAVRAAASFADEVAAPRCAGEARRAGRPCRRGRRTGRASGRSSPVQRRGGQGERDQLAALVLHPGPAVAHGAAARPESPRGGTAGRRPGPAERARPSTSSAAVASPGRATRVTAGRRCRRRAASSSSPASRPAAASASRSARTIHSGCAGDDGQVAAGRRRRPGAELAPASRPVAAGRPGAAPR